MLIGKHPTNGNLKVFFVCYIVYSTYARQFMFMKFYESVIQRDEEAIRILQTS